jgi:chromosome segregation ATPase
MPLSGEKTRKTAVKNRKRAQERLAKLRKAASSDKRQTGDRQEIAQRQAELQNFNRTISTAEQEIKVAKLNLATLSANLKDVNHDLRTVNLCKTSSFIPGLSRYR